MAAPVAPAAARHGLQTLRVDAVEALTDDALAITFAVPEELRDVFAFAPGQHLALVRPGDEHGVRRSYSVCSPVGGPLRVAVKLLPGGAFSTWVHEELAPGDEVLVLPPAGRFTVTPDPSRSRRYVALAAGSGITPVLSILGSVLAGEPRSSCTLVYGNRTLSSIMFLEELEDLKDRHRERLQLIHVLSREGQEAELGEGRIDAPKLVRLLDSLVPPEDVDAWFVCGPFGMVRDARATLRARGVDAAAIHRELFHGDESAPPPARARPVADGATGAAVTLVLDGRRTRLTVPRDGPAILDAALAVRPDAPFSCKGGVCGTCRCRLVEGEVHMDHRYALEDDEVSAGIVLACQAHPVTDTVVLDFDLP